MLDDIIIGQYIEKDSIIHNLDPRTKILVIMFFIMTIFLLVTFKGYFALAILILVTILLAKIKPGYMIKSIKPLLFIILFTFFIHLFMTRGG